MRSLRSARHQEGEIALQRAINLAQESGHRPIAAAAYRNLAGSDVLRGIYPRADRRLAEAESLGSGEAGEAVEVAAIRGVGLLDRGDIDGAVAVFRRGLDADPGRGHGFLPIMLTHAGRAGLLAGDFPAARGHLDEALQIAQTRSWAGVTAAPLALLGHVAVATGDLVTARDCSFRGRTRRAWEIRPGRRYRRTRRAAASRGGCPSTADDQEKGGCAFPSTFNLYRTGGLAARPGPCRIIAGRGKNLRKWESRSACAVVDV